MSITIEMIAMFIVGCCLTGVILTFKNKSNQLPSEPPKQDPQPEPGNPSADTIDYSQYYQRKWMFTKHEKGAYFALKNMAEPLGFTVFAKVRLWDLVDPTDKNDKKWMWKIQAKHCDFVLVDRKLVARIIVELDDSSHDRPDRMERDVMVDSILEACGYYVIHAREIDSTVAERLRQMKEELDNRW